MDGRLEARAALERLAQHRNLTITMLIEELAFEADRRTAQRLTVRRLRATAPAKGSNP